MNPSRRTSRPANSQFSRYRLRIGRSKIHRWGMFALETIPRGRKVIEYMGQRLTWKKAARRARRNIRLGKPRENVYFARLNRHWMIDGKTGASGAQFINHSCDPNLSHRRIRGHLLYFSRRRIRPGEELSVDYCMRKYDPKTPCHCGSSKCRGALN